MKRLATSRLGSASAGALIALLIAGGGYAIAGGTGMIGACVHQRGGGLYVARRCPRSDARLRWSVAGPRGPAGTAGVAGSPGPAGAAGPPGAAGSPGTPALYNRTVLLNYRAAADGSPQTSTYHELESLGSFTKLQASSAITLIWSSHATGGNGSTTFCDYQLRIDGADDQGYTGTDVGSEPLGAATGATVFDADSPFSVTDVFNGLGSGTHTVTIWDFGSAPMCAEDPGNFTGQVYVLETP